MIELGTLKDEGRSQKSQKAYELLLASWHYVSNLLTSEKVENDTVISMDIILILKEAVLYPALLSN